MKLRVQTFSNRNRRCPSGLIGLIALLLVAGANFGAESAPDERQPVAPARPETDDQPETAQRPGTPEANLDEPDRTDKAEMPHRSQSTGSPLGRKTSKGLGSLTGKRTDANAMLWRMLASVAVIALLGGVAYFLLRRFGPRFKMAPTRRIRLLETLALGARKNLHLVEIDGQKLLLGSGRESISVLTQLDRQEETPAADRHTDQDPRASSDQARQDDSPARKGDFQRALQEQMRS